MKNINFSLKALFLGFALAGIFTTTPAMAAAETTGQLCNKGGYIKRVSQGWPHENHVIAITLRDESGTETNWTTSGSGEVNTNAWARNLLATALTAYANQTYVYPTVTSGKCFDIVKANDGRNWNHRWEGLIYSTGPGVY